MYRLIEDGLITPSQADSFDADHHRFGICFPAGTLIGAWDGSTIAIEDIEAGHSVSSYLQRCEGDQSQIASELLPGKVVRTFNNVTEDWVEVHFVDPTTGDRKALTATPGHVMLTPEGGYKQLIEMIDTGDEEPAIAGERSEAQSLGDYAGSVRLVLVDSQIVTAQAWSIRYSEATAHLYEEAEMLITRTEGGLALKPEVRRLIPLSR